jgi:hypothetical protein
MTGASHEPFEHLYARFMMIMTHSTYSLPHAFFGYLIVVLY